MKLKGNELDITLRKYRAVQARFKVLYHTDRLRRDDAYKKLCEEFFISQSRLFYILGLDIPNEEQEGDKNQLKLWEIDKKTE